MAKKKDPTPEEERPSVHEMLGRAGGHREYKIGCVTYVVDGRYAEPKTTARTRPSKTVSKTL